MCSCQTLARAPSNITSHLLLKIAFAETLSLSLDPELFFWSLESFLIKASVEFVESVELREESFFSDCIVP